MLYRGDAMIKLTLQGKNGAIGSIEDIYFDDVAWVARYLVVDTGDWLSSRQVLIAPEALQDYHDDEGIFTTDLSRQQVEDSPPVESNKPVSRQHEDKLRSYYGWYPYWNAPVFPWTGAYAYPAFPATAYPGAVPGDRGGQREAPVVEQEVRAREEKNYDPHLRSFKEIKKYGIRASDGDIGEIEDVLIEPESWRITHLVADTRKWWPSKHVVVDQGMVRDINWQERKLAVDLTRDEIKNAPEFDRHKGISESYQQDISDYYSDLEGAQDSRMARNTLAQDPGA